VAISIHPREYYFSAKFPSKMKENEAMKSMAEERKKVNFPIREMTYFLDGSEESTNVKLLF
jgi:hypothetical protein